MDIQRVLIADALDTVAIKILEAKNIQVDIKTGLSEAQLIQDIPLYDALMVRSSTQVTSNIISAGSKLKVIGRAGVGVDNIDVEAATNAGVLVIK